MSSNVKVRLAPSRGAACIYNILVKKIAFPIISISIPSRPSTANYHPTLESQLQFVNSAF
ncbi:MAG: hypothetical protein LBD73_00615 [Deferribacteraceae bacterium]|jgi:hypothetical protein|nr:hypothetical protein [Deferribacteraceae bacterium]